MSTPNTPLLRSPITTHVLDTARGVPARGIGVVLEQKVGDAFLHRGEGVTNADGRLADLLTPGTVIESGVYRLTFATGDYFANRGEAAFYPEVVVTFEVGATEAETGHYHVPLLLSPFGYSTYRGS